MILNDFNILNCKCLLECRDEIVFLDLFGYYFPSCFHFGHPIYCPK